ncbi:MAG TPA: threonine/serine dehydratase [Candidatus Binatia bacterium]|nr:threonine/serine dehydratase [Candidatus Binatia bacterium]
MDEFTAGHLEAIRKAAERIAARVRRTPALPGSDLAPQLVLKPELLQPTGSFKVRGAFNAVLSLLEHDRQPAGVIAVSSGNHGQAVALAARTTGLACVVVMPADSNPIKMAAVRALGAEVISEGITGANREQRVLEIRAETGLTLVHPFDSWDVIHGQGTIGLELVDDVPDLGMLVTPVGGGGLISGCALAIKALRPEVQVVGVEPELAGDAAASKRSGRHESLPGAPATIADGLRSLSIGERGFEVIVGRGLVDQIVTVTEAEIEAATLTAWTRLHLAVEPSGAVPLAAFLTGRLPRPAAGRTVLVLSGGNADPALIARLMARPAVPISDAPLT